MRLILAIIILCAVARADTRITWLADVTADRAETVTGAQSNQIHDAAAHIVRADNPHGVTAEQIGALTNELDLAALRTFHYGSPDIVESPAGWFVFDGAGTITAFNWAEGRENVVIPWAIGGVPVTAIGANAFRMKGIVSLIAPQTVTSIGDAAFDSCTALASVSLPQAQTVGGYAFYYCYSLTSVSLPQAQTVGSYAFDSCTSLASVSLLKTQAVGAYAFEFCTSLASVSLPQAQTVGAGAFYYCTALTSVYFDDDAPAIGADIFEEIAPNQVKNYVANPQATGWGDTLGGMPVVRLPLYADAIYQAGELVATEAHVAQAIAAIPDSIVRGVSVSSTNILVSSADSVYYVALTNAANIGFDFSALSLGGTKRADITAVIDCLNTQALYSAINTNLVAMDCPWEPTVTGRYELAVSSDGVRVNAWQEWPVNHEWRALKYMGGSTFDAIYGFWQYNNLTTTNGISFYNEFGPGLVRFRISISRSGNGGTGLFSVHKIGHNNQAFNSSTAFAEFFVPPGPNGTTYTKDAMVRFEPVSTEIGIKIWVLGSPDTLYVQQIPYSLNFYRRANALERAAYNAGSYPVAFRLDY